MTAGHTNCRPTPFRVSSPPHDGRLDAHVVSRSRSRSTYAVNCNHSRRMGSSRWPSRRWRQTNHSRTRSGTRVWQDSHHTSRSRRSAHTARCHKACQPRLAGRCSCRHYRWRRSRCSTPAGSCRWCSRLRTAHPGRSSRQGRDRHRRRAPRCPWASEPSRARSTGYRFQGLHTVQRDTRQPRCSNRPGIRRRGTDSAPRSTARCRWRCSPALRSTRPLRTPVRE